MNLVATHATAPLNAEGGVSSTCTTGSSGNIKMGQGANATGTSSTDAAPLRRMVAAGDATSWLNYGVFTDTGRTNAWENATGVAYTGDGSCSGFGCLRFSRARANFRCCRKLY